MNKEAMKIAALVLGVVIGAGFASGREIITFFFQFAPFSLLLFFVVLLFVYYVVYIFIRVGAYLKPKTMTQLTKPIFKKYYRIIDTLASISFFIAMFAMLAGIDALAGDVFPNYSFPFFSIILSVLTAIIVLGGLNSVMNLNSVIVPVLIVVVLLVPSAFLLFGEVGVVTLNSEVSFLNIGSGVFSATLYICMNMITIGVILSQLGNTISKKTAKRTAVFSSILLTLCVGLVLTAIINSSNVIVSANMPMVLIAYKLGSFVGGVYSMIVAIGIFTTLVAASFALDNWTKQFLSKKGASIAIIITLAFLISRLGFVQIVDLFYPLEGLFGFVFILGIVVYYYKNRVKIEQENLERKLVKRKKTKNNSIKLKRKKPLPQSI
jgi:uncharacterized membrane protein YkvI